jgi:alginate O-acetyltransferase complex protein AlgI
MYFLDTRFILLVPLFVAVYWAIGSRWRNAWLLIATLGWIGFFSLQTLIAFAVMMLAVVYPTVVLAARALRSKQESKANQIGWVGIAALVGVATFLRVHNVAPFVEIPNMILQWVGFSYFLLKGIHVIRSVAKSIHTPPSLWVLTQYFFFLPTLTSGPLYRIDGFESQLAATKQFAAIDLQTGAQRITIGLFKKVVVVHALAELGTSLQWSGAAHPGAYVLTYATLYLDFSGYSDIAIGFGRWLGFSVPENFKNPFAATTMSQFWRNWHSSLGDWLRETWFIPMGGMRASGVRLSAIVVSSMILVGLWHEFKVKWILWSLYHGCILVIEQFFRIKPLATRTASRWQRYARIVLVQIIAAGGMFAFL